MRDLSDIRKEIDIIDDDIIALLARRFALMPEVIAYKRAHSLPAIIPERVEEVLQRNIKAAKLHGLDENLTQQIYSLIINTYCKMESNKGLRRL